MAKGTGIVVAAVVIALVLANHEDDDGGAATGSASGGGNASAAQFAASRQAMLRGEPTVAWSRLGMARTAKDASRRDTDCASHSYGQVRRYLRRVPCRVMDRVLFTVDDKGGNTIAIAVAWVRFDTPAAAREFKRIDDTWGTGQVRPLPGSTLGLPDIRLSGQHYASRREGSLTVVAEAEEVADGELDDAFLDEIAGVAVLLPH
ncbi:hypothetical protein [Actinophytocola gossypii]|uniref:Secreted protein n=1 Tax=Actinophytocola gossypii TaxID=2812003 RepID=A0ABT2JCC5_9PSEU|nr:hypothetical protein [Actinophytocola gossypii]MCT2585421.1 hypothetical protein [Actinophytocola gossypii]